MKKLKKIFDATLNIMVVLGCIAWISYAFMLVALAICGENLAKTLTYSVNLIAICGFWFFIKSVSDFIYDIVYPKRRVKE